MGKAERLRDALAAKAEPVPDSIRECRNEPPKSAAGERHGWLELAHRVRRREWPGRKAHHGPLSLKQKARPEPRFF